MPKVSVIVPVYKVENYLHQCIDSVLAQDWEDFELILVDDGSPDGCGGICDTYASKDSRIKVIHKENGGLSSARNAALPFVSGEFVFYLDSDDYLSPHALHQLLALQSETNADIVIGNYFYTYADHEVPAECAFSDHEVLDGSTAMMHLVCGAIQNFAWGKLIRSDIAVKHVFPEGRLFEDHYWAHLIFAEAKVTAILSAPILHYRQRESSISYAVNLKRLDMLDGWLCRKEFLERNDPELLRLFMEKTVVPGFLSLSWLVLTKMKHQQKTAFYRLRTFCKEQELYKYASEKQLRLINSLAKNPLFYAVTAVLYKLEEKVR